jgi:DNA-binding NtrC family response regulator
MARVLIVEDEGILVMNTRLQLEDMGHEVIGVADNAEEAFLMAEEFVPDLVILDIVIKGEMDGVALGDILHHDHGCKVIYMTGSPESITADIRHEGFLHKPFRQEDLSRAIEKALSS